MQTEQTTKLVVPEVQETTEYDKLILMRRKLCLHNPMKDQPMNRIKDYKIKKTLKEVYVRKKEFGLTCEFPFLVFLD